MAAVSSSISSSMERLRRSSSLSTSILRGGECCMVPHLAGFVYV